jgi:Queuosine biosynthesis protein
MVSTETMQKWKHDFSTGIAADPIAFEPPSAGFALDWHTLAAWRERGIGLATLTHAAGISSTGDWTLDLRLPFDEPYRIPERTAAAIKQAKSKGGRIIAIGTTVVRAIESAANSDGTVCAGDGVARGRIVRETPLRVIDAILTGVHQPGESHFELLRAFASDAVLDQTYTALVEHDYRTHEFGDSMLIERVPERLTRKSPDYASESGFESSHSTSLKIWQRRCARPNSWRIPRDLNRLGEKDGAICACPSRTREKPFQRSSPGARALAYSIVIAAGWARLSAAAADARRPASRRTLYSCYFAALMQQHTAKW